jgi:hypothetical protein
MKIKSSTSFPAFRPVEGQTKKAVGKKSDKDPHLSKTSLDPLYDTTDKYRRVIKPMKVEDFFSK